MSARRVALAALLLGCGAEQPAGPPAPEDRGPSAPAAPEGEPFAGVFEDATEASGVDFVHATGGAGQKLLPETMGAGACLFDADSDGALDLFLVNSGTLSPDDGGKPPGERSRLYRGRGDGTFADVSAASGADLEVYGMGATAADFDADGDRDLYVTALGPDVLLANDAGTFAAAGPARGLDDPGWTDDGGAWHPSWSTAATWLDADRDGDLDLFVGGYCRWTPELEIFTTLDGVHKAFTTPDRYEGLAPRLYANAGDGTFARVRDPAIEGAVGKSLGVTTWDLDADGYPEILVANDTRPNFLFRRGADGAWREDASRVGIAYDENGRARAGMGIDVADLAGDGGAWLAIGNFAGEPMSLYRWDGGVFRHRADAAGIARATLAPLAFGLRFLDADLDGRLDLAVLNGHIEPDVARFQPGARHAQPGQLFRGLAGGTFVPVGPAAGAWSAPRVGRGLAAGDLDGDGDPDLVATQNGGPAAVLLNRARERTGRRFLRVRCVGAGGNPDALGAVVTLRAGGRTQRRTVRAGASYLSQGELAVTFGLGAGAAVEELAVRWPSGRVQTVEVDAVAATVVAVERP